jgi:SAM-dependent methyltransferase
MFCRGQSFGALPAPHYFVLEQESNVFSDAEAYEQFMGRWSRLVAPLLVEFAGIGDLGRVLDVGSGTGSLAFSILKKKPHCSVLGIDPSEEYVAFAASRNPYGARAIFEAGDSQKLRFADATFENSLSLLVLNFISDPLKALREVRRVTKAGGQVAAAVWDYGQGMRMLRVFWDAAVSIDPNAEVRDERLMRLCRRGELFELWEKAGLTNVEERSLEITTRFENFRNYWDAFQLKQGPAGAYVAGLDRGRLRALRSEVRRRLGVSTENQPIALSARVWAARGTV